MTKRLAPFAALVAALIALIWTIPTNAQSSGLHLFGGRNHRVFLGCLDCGKFDSESVCNKFGTHGWKFATDSIWNKFGEYGSKFSQFSPWNKLANDPPIIVDSDGDSYGYFTTNRYHRNRTSIKFFRVFLDNPDEVNDDLDGARDLFCD